MPPDRFFDLPHVASRLYGTPLLVARPKLDVILTAIGPRLRGEKCIPSPAPRQCGALSITEDGIAVLPIMGTLVRRGSWMASASGMTSYHDIEAEAQEAFTHPAVRAVLMEIDSCGGEAGGVFDLADALRAMSDATGKPLWAVADESALSAAYAIACAADRIILTRTAEVGSVGVVAVHVDESEADAQAGLAYTYIHAGAHKVEGNPHEPLSPDVKNRLQTDVDALYSDFVELVARRRGCSPEIVRATEAAVFRGQDAVRAGLADAVGTLQQAHHDLQTFLQTAAPLPTSLYTPLPTEVSMSGIPTAAVPAETTAPLAMTNGPAAETALQGQAMQAEQVVIDHFTELSDIATLASRLGVTIDPTAELRAHTRPEALRRRVLETAAVQEDSLNVQSRVAVSNPFDTAKSDPLAAAVRTMHGLGGA